jgi:hypothetical protein
MPTATSVPPAVLLLALGIFVPIAAQTPEPKPTPRVQATPAPAEMQRLGFLIGTWHNTAVFLDRDGNEVGRLDAATDLPGGAEGNTIAPALGGWILESGAGSAFGRGWFRYDAPRAQYVLVAADFRGNFDILAGGFEGDELVLTEVAPKSDRGGGTIMWRWTYYDVGPDSFRLRQAFSRDGGRSWVLANRQTNRRLGT